jgi:hypothetical protein
MKKSPEIGTTNSVGLPGSGFELSTFTVRMFSPGRTASVASTRKRLNAPSCRPSLRPLTQTSATMLAASNCKCTRLPAAFAGSVNRSRYQPIPRVVLASGRRVTA